MERKYYSRTNGLAGRIIAPPGFTDNAESFDEPSNNDILKSSGNWNVVPAIPALYNDEPVNPNSLVRRDITEGTQTGIPLSIILTFINSDNDGLPVAGLRVDIWHCNKRGYYSAYDGQPGIDGIVNNGHATWLRGIQYTDVNGQVNFTTIFPGWYAPRATHIHIQVYDSSNKLLTTTQLAFPDEICSVVNAYYRTSGQNSYTNSNDPVFSNNYPDDLMVVGGSTGGYIATREIIIQGGKLGMETIEAETGGQFSRLGNYPNPFRDATTISYFLIQRSDVELTVSDLTGRVIERIIELSQEAGRNEIELYLGDEPDSGEYFYELKVSNYSGTFRQRKKMVKL
ncbi:MAG: intradiol ring-cleavage dioxygenase [Crocinitomicaceae bacterium]|jgi:protocatechuate 3,4-dioxygenase beta subunit|nr:intradiol ring-cleavage dioxygenase [Crocinitomicaceae bacterium]